MIQRRRQATALVVAWQHAPMVLFVVTRKPAREYGKQSAMVIRVRIRRRVTKPKQGFFTLKAEPRLKPDGPVRGFLNYVVFTARTTEGLQIWTADKNGHLIFDFSALVPERKAIDLVRQLYLGHTIELPGRYPLAQLRGRFGFPGEAE